MNNRRDFLKASAIIAAGGLAATGVTAEAAEAATYDQYSRWRPSFGAHPDSSDYLGKLTPGLRKPGLPPVPVQAPDIENLPHTTEDGRKTFRLSCEIVTREFLPGAVMDVWGFNGSMPGPSIQCVQGDRIRIIVTNNLPEATSMHWHGLELIADMDGVPGLTQDLIPPGGTFTYEFDLHQTGSFFYHSHMAMQEAMGMVGWLIVHPKVAYNPTCDRDFALIFQNFFIAPNQTIPDSRSMDWNWHTINGRSGPFTTPLLVKHGERVRVRLMDFSPMQHHPIHLHGHTFWLTGSEGGRIPTSAWIPRNNTLVGVAMVNDFEFVANNPGDWIFHCHMVHHMMNHMNYPMGPNMRADPSGSMQMNHKGMDMTGSMSSNLRDSLDVGAAQKRIPDDIDRELGQHSDMSAMTKPPGYPQNMKKMSMDMDFVRQIKGRPEVAGMRDNWYTGLKGLMTCIRVLPHDLYDRVVSGDPSIKPGEIFAETMRRVRRA